MKIYTFKMYVFVYIIPAPLARLAVDLGAQQATCTDAAATRTAGVILPLSSILASIPICAEHPDLSADSPCILKI